MRFLTIGALSIGLATAACGRGQVSAASASRDNADSSAAAAAKGAPHREVSAEAAFHEVVIPAGTQLPVALDTGVGSDISRVEQAVAAHLTRPIVLHGETVLPAGSRVAGVVTDATRSGRVKGRAHVALRFDSITPSGPNVEPAKYRIETIAVGRTAAATKKKDAMEIGAPAAGGALIGAIAGGKKGALIGTAIGGGAGTGVVLSTRGKEVRLPRGSALTLKLTEPLTVKVRG
jgi:hypothetical protein